MLSNDIHTYLIPFVCCSIYSLIFVPLGLYQLCGSHFEGDMTYDSPFWADSMLVHNVNDIFSEFGWAVT
jgi:hypothetical protein